MGELAARAREDRLRGEAERREWKRTRPPDRIQQLLAYEVGRVLGVEVDPRDVIDLGYSHPYYLATVTVEGITFTRRYMSDTNGLHAIAAPMTACRSVPRRWRRPRVETRDVKRIGDLDGWL